jgi:hypothetical protein
VVIVFVSEIDFPTHNNHGVLKFTRQAVDVVEEAATTNDEV